MIVVLSIAVFMMGLFKNESVAQLLWRFAFIVPMVEWLLNTVKQINKNIAFLKELDYIINDDKSKTMDDLQDIQ